MSDSQTVFNKRLAKLGRKHRKMEQGYTTKMRSDGLIVVKPRARGINFPFKGLLIVLAVFFLFKGFMLASVGAATYDQRVAALADGSPFEQGGAWVMQADPVTKYVAERMRPILR